MYKVTKVIKPANYPYDRGTYLVRATDGRYFTVLAGNKKEAAKGNIWGDPKPLDLDTILEHDPLGIL